MKKLLSASLMCADLLNLEKAIKELEKANIDYLHIDIMDGSFVPNITLGFDLINSIKKVTDIPLDIHMMVYDPQKFIERMNLTENDIASVHYESDIHIHRTLEFIKTKGCKAGLAINPGTPVESVKNLTEYIDMLLVMTVSPGFAGQKIFKGADKKVIEARKLLTQWGYADTLIQVDGNISLENGKKMYDSGADIFVLGTSSLFLKDKSLENAAKDFKEFLG
ncbi:MAG: ribulose-phosphate 3-epimerase [Ruminococcaceae bacterium]|nr:ribulose-phosphate 3-epimerase [Oscillospiraceae bacterium]